MSGPSRPVVAELASVRFFLAELANARDHEIAQQQLGRGLDAAAVKQMQQALDMVTDDADGRSSPMSQMGADAPALPGTPDPAHHDTIEGAVTAARFIDQLKNAADHVSQMAGTSSQVIPLVESAQRAIAAAEAEEARALRRSSPEPAVPSTQVDGGSGRDEALLPTFETSFGPGRLGISFSSRRGSSWPVVLRVVAGQQGSQQQVSRGCRLMAVPRPKCASSGYLEREHGAVQVDDPELSRATARKVRREVLCAAWEFI